MAVTMGATMTVAATGKCSMAAATGECSMAAVTTCGCRKCAQSEHGKN
jgi:hypothetical protein